MKKDYFWNTLGVLLQNAISPLLLVVVTRVNGIHDSGLFSFAFSVSIILWSLAMWGGRTYQVSDATKEFSARGYIAVRVILGILVMLCASAFVLINGYTPEKAMLILILALLKVLESIADVIYGILQVNGRLYTSGISLTIKTATGLLAFIITILLTRDLLLSSSLLLLANALVIVFFDIPHTRVAAGIVGRQIKINIRNACNEAVAIMKRSSPILAMSLLAVLSINIPRYFLDKYHESQIGYFGVLAMPIALLTLLITFMLQPNVVQLSQLYSKNIIGEFRRIIVKIMRYTSVIGVITLLGTYLVGVPVLNAIFGIDFADYKAALVVVVLGAIANTIVGIMTNALTIMRHFKLQFITLLTGSLVLVPLCAVLVPLYGLFGAVSLYCAVNVAQAACLYIVYIRIVKRRVAQNIKS